MLLILVPLQGHIPDGVAVGALVLRRVAGRVWILLAAAAAAVGGRRLGAALPRAGLLLVALARLVAVALLLLLFSLALAAA